MRRKPNACTTLAAVLLPLAVPAAALDNMKGSSQAVVIAADAVDGFTAKVSLWEKGPHGWKVAIADLPAVIGKKGLTPYKKEGDGKSPEGVFPIGDAYGYTAKPPEGLKLKYTQLLDSFQGVDDPESAYYNQILDTRLLPNGGAGLWKSHEVMRRKDDLYKWLAVVRYNEANVKGDGSLIFLHIWRGLDQGTAGCVALSEESVLKILGRLDPAKKPVAAFLTKDGAAAWPKPTP